MIYLKLRILFGIENKNMTDNDFNMPMTMVITVNTKNKTGWI